MSDQLAVSMRTTSSNARDFMGALSSHGFGRIQLDSLHCDFHNLTNSGLRDLASTLQRNGLKPSGVDFLAPPTNWETDSDQTLTGFGRAIEIASSIGRVPVSVCIPPRDEIIDAIVASGTEVGVLIAAHGAKPLNNPQIGWGLPVSLLAKEDRPMEALAGASFGPIALRLTGNVIESSTIAIDEETLELRELRGVLDAMRWTPSPVIDASTDYAELMALAWEKAGETN